MAPVDPIPDLSTDTQKLSIAVLLVPYFRPLLLSMLPDAGFLPCAARFLRTLHLQGCCRLVRLAADSRRRPSSQPVVDKSSRVYRGVGQPTCGAGRHAGGGVNIPAPPHLPSPPFSPSTIVESRRGHLKTTEAIVGTTVRRSGRAG